MVDIDSDVDEHVNDDIDVGIVAKEIHIYIGI